MVIQSGARKIEEKKFKEIKSMNEAENQFYSYYKIRILFKIKGALPR